MSILTAHCIVKNEENFFRYAFLSVIDTIDQMIIFDTGSQDNTVAIIQECVRLYPKKVIFEQKGDSTREQHTRLRQEMVDRTTTTWFMVLDGDEVWSEQGIQEAANTIRSVSSSECLIAPFHLCVGDIYHEYYQPGSYDILGKKGNHTPRFFKKIRGIHWSGEYDKDTLLDSTGAVFFTTTNSLFLQHGFWHLTHLQRSRHMDDYSSGGIRQVKVMPTYFLVGKTIHEKVPEVFRESHEPQILRLPYVRSCINFFVWSIKKLTKNFGKRMTQ